MEAALPVHTFVDSNKCIRNFLLAESDCLGQTILRSSTIHHNAGHCRYLVRHFSPIEHRRIMAGLQASSRRSTRQDKSDPTTDSASQRISATYTQHAPCRHAAILCDLCREADKCLRPSQHCHCLVCYSPTPYPPLAFCVRWLWSHSTSVSLAFEATYRFKRRWQSSLQNA